MNVYSWLQRNLSSRSKKITGPSADKSGGNHEIDDLESYGITGQLIEFVKAFNLDTFNKFPVSYEEGDADGNSTTSRNVRKDLSDWQERHATLVLAQVKELSQLRFRLCPRYLKDHQFWGIYFMLVKSFVAEFELHAKLRHLAMENNNISGASACEVEMSEAKHTATPMEYDSDSHTR